VAPTVGRDLGIRRSAQRFLVVHGNDGVAGSIRQGLHIALTSGNTGHLRGRAG
jgi:hypothetical protein